MKLIKWFIRVLQEIKTFYRSLDGKEWERWYNQMAENYHDSLLREIDLIARLDQLEEKNLIIPYEKINQKLKSGLTIRIPSSLLEGEIEIKLIKYKEV